MPSLGGWPDVPCVECGKHVSGIPWGERCPACAQQRKRRASRLASRVALGATLLMGVYIAFQPIGTGLARIYAIVAVLATYILVRRITQHLAMAWLAEQRARPETPDAET